MNVKKYIKKSGIYFLNMNIFPKSKIKVAEIQGETFRGGGVCGFLEIKSAPPPWRVSRYVPATNAKAFM